jgi:hypothetical protein
MRCGAGRGAVRVRVRGVVKVRVTTELGYLYYIYKPSRYTTTAAAAVESVGSYDECVRAVTDFTTKNRLLTRVLII